MRTQKSTHGDNEEESLHGGARTSNHSLFFFLHADTKRKKNSTHTHTHTDLRQKTTFFFSFSALKKHGCVCVRGATTTEKKKKESVRERTETQNEKNAKQSSQVFLDYFPFFLFEPHIKIQYQTLRDASFPLQ